MAGVKVTQAGLGVRGSNLVVGLQIETGVWSRFATVDVPLVLLLNEDVTEALDRTVRRRLIERWSEQVIDEPLPFMGDIG